VIIHNKLFENNNEDDDLRRHKGNRVRGAYHSPVTSLQEAVIFSSSTAQSRLVPYHVERDPNSPTPGAAALVGRDPSNPSPQSKILDQSHLEMGFNGPLFVIQRCVVLVEICPLLRRDLLGLQQKRAMFLLWE
jgi:hypothetical protein